jgi:hypothetical protein
MAGKRISNWVLSCGVQKPFNFQLLFRVCFMWIDLQLFYVGAC